MKLKSILLGSAALAGLCTSTALGSSFSNVNFSIDPGSGMSGGGIDTSVNFDDDFGGGSDSIPAPDLANWAANSSATKLDDKLFNAVADALGVDPATAGGHSPIH